MRISAVQARFLLGPAGSGKTFRCLAEVRAALASNPDGHPLILLAPKQATFQIERQLLADGEIAGFTRLQILSCDRLAQFVLDALHVAPPKLLSSEGRLMVLRALLHRHAGELKLFSGSAKRGGFAQELGTLLAELQQHQFGPAKLRALAANEKLRRELRAKLHDLALLSEKYDGWLRENNLSDANNLLDFATQALRGKSLNSQLSTLNLCALWLDGFAEMTPQELALLTAVIPFCETATLAFCLETEPAPTASWLSIWSAIGKTFQQCRDQISALPGCEVRTEILQRTPGKNRFAPDSELAALEETWALPNFAAERRSPTRQVPVGVQSRTRDCQPDTLKRELQLAEPVLGAPANSQLSTLNPQLSLTACANPEAEAVHAAREILRFVRAHPQNRFRDCAVLVRQLDGYHQPLARTFRRYDIPFFLDRRESVAHHPLAELTRNALRTVAFDWRADDWFAALKAGFAPVDEQKIDDLENRALEFGWRGKKWREPLPDEGGEALRKIIFPPFEKLHQQLQSANFEPTGAQLAEFIRELWRALDVENVLDKWAADESAEAASVSERRAPARQVPVGVQALACSPPAQPDKLKLELQLAEPPLGAPGHASLVTRHSSPHQTVWEQMNSWLDNVALAFPHEPMSLRDWLSVLEAGLGNLTVGVIPPALDEVLVGAIDRARNPNLKLALVLGVNESVFPAAPAAPVILTSSDRAELDAQNAAPGSSQLDQISRERYLGYIACTRANEKLALTFSKQSADGKTLNPSPLIAQVKNIFPELAVEEFSGNQNWHDAAHANELVTMLTNAAERRSPTRPVGVHALACPADNPACGIELQRELAEPVLGAPLLAIPALKSLAEKLAQLRAPDAQENLSPALAEKLYGGTLRSSVSRLEEFAACPFKFFVKSGLRANERKTFELDARERGNFQHDVLKVFHEQLQGERLRWRDIEPSAARARIGKIAAAQMELHRDGLFRDSAATAFAARAMSAALQDFVEVVVGWMRGQYEFDPAAAELGFGGKDDALPAWEIHLDGGRKLALQGRIDRVDLWRSSRTATGEALAVVVDYKSGGKKLEPLLVANGIQLQLLAYLAALRHWSAEHQLGKFQKNEGDQRAEPVLGAPLIPAGAFYVNLRGEFKGGDTRDEILGDDAARKLAYRHTGRFDAGELRKFDRRTDVTKGDQFNFKLNKDGGLPSNSTEAIPGQEFTSLLDEVEAQLRGLGEKIFTGAAAVDPYRHGKKTPCEYCDYRAACRMDEFTHEWRVLRTNEQSSSSSSSSS